MIPSSAALPVVFGGRLLVLPLERRQAAGREPRSEQRSEGQPEYSGVSRLHLRHHRALTTGTPPTVTDIRLTVIHPTGIEPTRHPAMDIRDTSVLLHMLVSRAMDTRADLNTRITPLLPATAIPATRNIPLTSVRPATNTKPMKVIPLTHVRRAMDRRAIWDGPFTLVSSLTGIRTARFILPTRVPVMDLPRMDTLAIAPQRTGRLGLGMLSSLLAEVSSSSKPLSADKGQ
jgi:hypothetical protein